MGPTRILTTHVGSLPRPPELVELVWAEDRGEPVDRERYERLLDDAVRDRIRHQVQAGVDVVSDGEMSKIGYATYIRHRLSGFEVGDVPRATPADLDAFPRYRDRPDEELGAAAARHVEAINRALRDVPAERVRLHVCWGNYEGPHHLDIDVAKIVDVVLRAKPATILFEAANPRHEHEWAVWREI